jgi:hypothetical protein
MRVTLWITTAIHLDTPIPKPDTQPTASALPKPFITETSRFTCCTSNAAHGVQNRYGCPVRNVVVPREDLIRGYEYAKGKYVRFTEAELETCGTSAGLVA